MRPKSEGQFTRLKAVRLLAGHWLSSKSETLFTPHVFWLVFEVPPGLELGLPDICLLWGALVFP